MQCSSYSVLIIQKLFMVTLLQLNWIYSAQQNVFTFISAILQTKTWLLIIYLTFTKQVGNMTESNMTISPIPRLTSCDRTTRRVHVHTNNILSRIQQTCEYYISRTDASKLFMPGFHSWQSSIFIFLIQYREGLESRY